MSARSMLRPVAVALPFVLASGLLAGCTSTKTSGAGGSEVQLVEQGKLTVCTHLPYPPFQFKKSGKIVGFDVDMVDLVAKKLKADQEIVDTPFEGIQSGEDLNANKCDVAAAGMTINDVRKKNLDFSSPYFEATQALIAKKGAEYSSLDDLKGKKLGVQRPPPVRSTPRSRRRRTSSSSSSRTSPCCSPRSSPARSTRASTTTACSTTTSRRTRTPRSPPSSTPASSTASAYARATPPCGKQINETLKKAKSDGTYDKIYKKWFGKAPKK